MRSHQLLEACAQHIQLAPRLRGFLQPSRLLTPQQLLHFHVVLGVQELGRSAESSVGCTICRRDGTPRLSIPQGKRKSLHLRLQLRATRRCRLCDRLFTLGGGLQRVHFATQCICRSLKVGVASFDGVQLVASGVCLSTQGSKPLVPPAARLALEVGELGLRVLGTRFQGIGVLSLEVASYVRQFAGMLGLAGRNGLSNLHGYAPCVVSLIIGCRVALVVVTAAVLTSIRVAVRQKSWGSCRV